MSGTKKIPTVTISTLCTSFAKLRTDFQMKHPSEKGVENERNSNYEQWWCSLLRMFIHFDSPLVDKAERRAKLKYWKIYPFISGLNSQLKKKSFKSIYSPLTEKKLIKMCFVIIIFASIRKKLLPTNVSKCESYLFFNLQCRKKRFYDRKLTCYSVETVFKLQQVEFEWSV